MVFQTILYLYMHMMVSNYTFCCLKWKHTSKGCIFNHCNFLGISYFHGHYLLHRHYNHASFKIAEGAMEITWNAFMEDLEEILATDWNITGTNAAGVISIFKLVVNGRENFKPSHWFSFSIKGKKRTSRSQREVNKEKVRPKEKRSTEWSNNWRFEKLIFNKQYRPSMKYKKKALRNSLETSSVSSRTTESFSIAKRKSSKMSISFCCSRLGADWWPFYWRRVEQANETKQSLDKLPISTTVTATDYHKINGRRKVQFEHVFHSNVKFHCFTGKLNDRRDAIAKLEWARMETLFWGDEGDEASEEYSSEEDDANN